MFLVLTMICLISAALLASVNEVTKTRIATVQKQKLEDAIRTVVPGFDNSPLEEMEKVEFSEKDYALVYPARKEGKLIGTAVETFSMNGFSGEIRILTGLTPDGTLLNYAILQHAETPGLGDKMDPWFKTDRNNQSILGKKLSQQTLKLKKDGGDIDAITASTISSRAFIEAVNKAWRAVSGEKDSISGATTGTDGNSGATSTGTDAGSGATSPGTDAKSGATSSGSSQK